MPVEKQASARRRPRGDQRSQNVFMVAGLFKLACLRLPPQIVLIFFYCSYASTPFGLIALLIHFLEGLTLWIAGARKEAKPTEARPVEPRVRPDRVRCRA
jgi:hypothetical protein